ncbi:ApeP family dehydratase [Methylomicrobium sp. RS1]|jgi:predicted hotdog family 3-hydroxylacyl-ACP dehydratase|uniref:ApeP family dehydratase n=1 Tax=Candidatus Methylomicrobium oryzae TaxID=2802053 RepID=UPI001920AF99|nr:hotdog family protein [Methylomicrobium sp. RS1]MBL1264388.1 hotdog family protein [Methylomicrobium sp. RS1]
MNDFPLFDIAELLPHTGGMIWLDKVLAWDEETATAELTVRAGPLFGGGDTVPAWAGIEYMAQTIGLYAGLHAKRAGEPIRLGFLLGTRRFESSAPGFRIGSVLTVRVEKIMQDGHLSVFDCRITGDHVKVSAVLNVYQAPLDTIMHYEK